MSPDVAESAAAHERLTAHNRRLRRLAEVIERVATARDLDTLMDVIRPAIRELSGADGATLVLNDAGHCHYVDEDAIGPLWKGRRFPLESWISGWCMIHGEAVAIEDIYADPRIPHEAYRPTFVKSLSMVPVGRAQPVAAIGCYWAETHRATVEELELQQALADAMSVGLANVALFQSLEQRIAERDAALSQAAAAAHAKSAFLANMSHEMRTPLHVIIGLSHLLTRDEKDATQQTRLRRLTENSEHLLGIINDILDLSKADVRRLVVDSAPFHLGDLLKRLRRMLELEAEEKGLALSVATAEALRDAVVMGDAQRLMQVLLNLCGNAIKFTEHGSVGLAVEGVGESADALVIRFTVTDTGRGIDAAERQRLFEAFEQGDNSPTRLHGGTGLGLAISQRLVELMGGRIEVSSQPGQGSVFFFELPLPRVREPVPEHPPARAAAAAGGFPGMRVLFAEDHPMSQEIVLEMLEDLGCDGEVAGNGLEALECARTRHYDLILMDMQMPGMDGLAATRAIRALPAYRATPIIALTANAFAEDRQRCLEAGMNAHLAKPLTPTALAATLAQWLPVAAAAADEPCCDSALGRTLARIEGLDVRPNWRRSEQHLLEYRARLLRFVAGEGEELARLHAFPQALDRAGAASLAHQLKGIAGLLGALQVQALAAQLEQALRGDAAAAAVQELVVRCEDELRRLGAAVEAACATPS